MPSVSSGKKTSLEWFYGTGSAANFPQTQAVGANSSTAGLQHALGRLVDSFGTIAPGLVGNEAGAWRESYRELLLVQEWMRTEFTTEVARQLLITVRGVVEFASEIGDRRDPFHRDLKRLLSDMIVWAGNSPDFTFKRELLAVVRSFTAQ